MKPHFTSKAAKALWTAMALLLSVFFASAQGVFQLTNNSYDDTYQRISGNYMVWQGGYDIVAYNLETGQTIPIAIGSFGDSQPHISGENIVWCRSDGTDSEIFAYNLGTAITTQITDNAFDDYSPFISGNQIVWRGGGNYYSEIFYHNLDTKETTQISDSPPGMGAAYPQISGDYIVWNTYDFTFSGPEVYVHNLKTGITKQITNNFYLDGYAETNGHIVMWMGNDGENGDIFIYNLETEISTKITDNPYEDFYPKISGNRIVWAGEDGNDTEIFVYDLKTGSVTQITDNTEYEVRPYIFLNFVVWERTLGSDTEIIGYDLKTGISYQITDNSFYDIGPLIERNYIAWVGVPEGSDYEILLHELDLPCFPDETPPAVTCPPIITVGTNPAYFDPCAATVLLPAPEVSDNCAALEDIVISVKTSFGSQGFGPHADVPVGAYTVTYTATDEWGLASSCESTLQVVDDDPPIAVCDEITQINFYSTVSITLPASVFDDGSYDNCGLITIKGSRDGGLNFSEDLTFTCGDDGTIVPVIMRVYAANDPLSFGECEVMVMVEDKLPPSIPCPFNPTPQEQIEALIAIVTNLFNEGEIGNGPYTALLKKLEQILANINADDPCKAIQKLEVFITLVQAFIPNQISAENGQALINAAQAAIDQLESDCNPPAHAMQIAPEFALGQNYPNPLTEGTIIPFSVPEESYVTLTVYDLNGNEVAVLVDGVVQAGNHRVNFQAGDLPEGLYLYALKTGQQETRTRRMAVLR